MTAILAMLAAIAAYALLRPVDRPPEVIVGPVAPDTLVGPTAPEIPGFAFTPLATPSPAPEVRFWEGGWSPLGLADFRGKVVLLNFWATWCPPCRREMPTLDRLQAELGGPDFEVVALSVDRGGGPQVEAFFEQLNLTNLKLYVDPTMRSVQAFRVVGLPTTVLLDRRGYELGRVVGPAEWDSPAAIALVQGAIAEGSDPKEAEGGAAGPEASSPSPTAPFANWYAAVLVGTGVLVLFGLYLLTRRRAARAGQVASVADEPEVGRSSAPVEDRRTRGSGPRGS